MKSGRAGNESGRVKRYGIISEIARVFAWTGLERG